MSDSILQPGMPVCLAGKNDVAVACLRRLISAGWRPDQILVVPNRDDTGRSTWQHSLLFHARSLGARVCGLEHVMSVPDIRFFSVEFDRILRPAAFSTCHLYNVHFSRLPSYRGVATAVWPILRGERESGVTFHRIDEGVDTGPVILRRTFPIGPEMNARGLYFRCMAEAEILFAEALGLLMSGKASETPQEAEGASLFRRRDLDFSRNELDVRLGRDAALAWIRAFSFWEYQLPMVGGRPVWSARASSTPATGPVGHLCMTREHTGILSLADGDIEVKFSPYGALFAWAEGSDPQPPDLAEVPDLDLQDRQGWSALMRAAHFGNAAAIRILVAAGASPVIANRRGTTPLMYAFSRMMETGDAAGFDALLDLGADPQAIDQHERRIADYIPPEKRAALRCSHPALFS